jgi:CheY-like chemotaxis protein
MTRHTGIAVSMCIAQNSVTNLERVMTKEFLISVVDDDQCVRDVLEHLIRSMGCYKVATFSSAEEYLQSGVVGRTSCLISDYQMPGMTGADLQRRLIADGYRIQIIFLSANWSEEDRGVDAGEFYISESYRYRIDEREHGYNAKSNSPLSLAYRHLRDNQRGILARGQWHYSFIGPPKIYAPRRAMTGARRINSAL